MNMKTCLLVSAVLLVGVAYYVYYPFPPDADEPWKQMMSMVFIRTINHVCNFEENIGYSSEIQCRQWFSSFLTKTREELSDANLEVTEPLFGGVKVRLYIPKDSNTERRGFVYIHGGGWYLGNVDTFDEQTRKIAQALKAVVVSIDYRLAPEHPYPIPLEDCIHATTHFLRYAKDYGADPTRIGIGGDSAGGNLAMAVALKLAKSRETTLPPLRTLSLVYPALQMADFNLPSYITYTDGPFLLTKRLMISAWLIYAFGHEEHFPLFFNNSHLSPKSRNNIRHYLNDTLLPENDSQRQLQDNAYSDEGLARDIESVVSNQFISPLLSPDEDLRKLPKMLLFTCQYDPLTDEGRILVKRLSKLGIPIVYKHFTGVQHGFLSSKLVVTMKGRQAFTDYVEFLEKEL
ncbi:arylacetamide deacetylase-like [Pecten maximus]|uniref:arylacetamide deacetylase-like n=1 Tax=Pecten maximus TaxID=6579 RepID=UPI001458AE48|nr:arylacetamide deacetylase-like [Pecten maximus]